MSKYRAVATMAEGRRFHSKGEAGRYQELRLLERAGEIESLECQPVFVLHAPSCTGTMKGALKALAGDKLVIGKYIADFKYFDGRQGGWIVEDFKGMDLPLGKWKRKHAEKQYGITITVTGRKGKRRK